MLTTVDDLDDVMRFWRWLSERDVIAVDTETTGHSPFAPGFHIRLVQVGSATAAWVFDFRRWYGVIDEMFRKFSGRVVFHNSNYDAHAFAAEGITVPWHAISDTMIALRLAQPDQSAALKNAADRLIGPGASGSQKELRQAFRDNKWDWDTVPLDFPPYIFYAAMDVILTSRLDENPVVRLGYSSPVYPLEMEIRALANRMERNGLRVDLEYSNKKSYELREEAAALKQEFEDEFGFSPTSTQALGRWLLTNATHLMTKVTDSGAPSTDKEQLEAILHGDVPVAARVAKTVLRVRRLEKLASSYFDNFVTLSDENGIVHAEIETLAARTGRMSIRKPGLQTLPRVSDDPETRIVRRAVIPRQDDHVLISCDSDQIELRLAAALSDDRAMMDAFRTSDDFFTTLMREIYNDPSAQKSDPRRAAVKTTMYAKTYGAGPAKIAMAAGVSEKRIRELLAGLESAYPDYSRLSDRFEDEARSGDGWVTNPYGRRLKVDRDKLYSATNYVIQSTAADILKQSIVDCGHAGLEDYLCLPVHDELVLSVPKDDAEEVAQLVEKVMTNEEFSLTLTASAGSPAANWAEAK